jgi:hypothetical protein
MIKISLSHDFRKDYLEKSFKSLKNKFLNCQNSRIHKKNKDFLKLLYKLTISDDPEKSILTQNYSNLLKSKIRIQRYCNRNNIVISKKSNILSILNKIYNYNSFSRNWAYKYSNSVGIEVCPYCNRNWTPTILNKDNKVVRCELDHFLPQSANPWFAISLYNLVPVCHTCNHKKLEKDLYYNPFSEALIDKIKFYYIPKNLKGAIGDPAHFDVIIEPKAILKKSEKRKILKHLKTLSVPELYQNFHNQSVANIIKLSYIYNEEYILALYKQFSLLFSSEEELKSILFGAPMQEEDIGKMPLGKLTYDILKELRG